MTRFHRSNKAKFKLYKPKNKGKTEDEIIQELQAACDSIDVDKIESFDDFPLSEKTKKGLRKHRYTQPTEIQKVSLGHTLRGEDVLGAAKTGSGKTLAFLIPIIEVLYRKKWTKYDHVGALVITPTRELAYQIFETLRKIGEFHDFSAGLIIGGKDLKFEVKRMDQCNIVICTPGRLLQHMDENPLLDCSSLQILVLDEADRCLDMGFEKTMNSIIENLPAERQTLLFSATQTRSVKDLARLSLTDPRYISVDENAQHSTPSGLVQSFINCDLHDKINFLWSFIKNHRSHKVLVFLSSCKQVKFVFELFCKMKPGVSLLALYGSLHQMKRMAVYDSFCQKQHVVLFATDIAARGLDFPNVNWVVQLDCPESANEYIHRAGRTARYQRAGESLLVLLPSEMSMLQHLESKKIPIQEIQVNVKKLQNIQRNMEALLARDLTLKETAQRAFVAYMKSVFLMKDKEIFDVSKLDTDAFARSLGLAVTPRLRFLQKRLKNVDNQKKMKPDNQEDDKKEDSDFLTSFIRDDQEDDKDDDREFLSSFATDDQEDPKSASNDFLFVKRKNHELDIELPVSETGNASSSKKSKKPVTKASIVKKMLKKKILPNKKTVFNDDGEVVVNVGKEYVSNLAREYGEANEAGIDIEKAQMVLREEDKYDKELFRQKVKRKHREEKLKLKEKNKDEQNEAAASSNDEEDDDDDEGPDLSWLPDPDTWGARKSDSEDAGEDESESEALSEEETNKTLRQKVEWKMPKKRKCDVQAKPAKKKKPVYEDENEDELGNPEKLAEDEELALQIMNQNLYCS